MKVYRLEGTEQILMYSEYEILDTVLVGFVQLTVYSRYHVPISMCIVTIVYLN
jgi:hypothetical protein